MSYFTRSKTGPSKTTVSGNKEGIEEESWLEWQQTSEPAQTAKWVLIAGGVADL